LSELFEKTARKINPLLAARWLRFELLRVLNYNKKELSETEINEKHMISLLTLIEENKITETTAQKILEKLAEKPFDINSCVKEHKLMAISGVKELEKICRDVILKNPKVVSDYKKGRKEALHFLIGQVMKATKGKASPKELKQIFTKLIN
ncbi:Asp-tRNA(Asn)/Glu-tRNA(Gln) amidotransferase GatCAB subunit B, partial [Candidatus Woesearchaeota archaeon CG_4_10_14_0_2_um_filter_33_10]